MKKLISFLLVIMLLSSISVSAFAGEPDTKIGVSEAEAVWTAVDDSEKNAKTQVWLQVEADGQIDVTVPLMLVFRTNIDGGYANTATNYALTNNSTAELAVTNVAVDHSFGDNNDMTICAYNENISELDNYGVYFKSGNFEFDATNVPAKVDAIDGGHFVLPKASVTDGSNEVAVDVKMSTGPLSFVTKHDDNGIMADWGIQLITVEYTVGINTKNAHTGSVDFGDPIPDANWIDGTDNS